MSLSLSLCLFRPATLSVGIATRPNLFTKPPQNRRVRPYVRPLRDGGEAERPHVGAVDVLPRHLAHAPARLRDSQHVGGVCGRDDRHRDSIGGARGVPGDPDVCQGEDGDECVVAVVVVLHA